MLVPSAAATAGLICCAAAIAGGAFGAHALEGRLDERGLALWQTAARHLMYSGLGLALLGLTRPPERSLVLGAAGWSLGLGGLIFATTVGGMALGAPRWLGAVTPIGGALMIAGFLAFAWGVWPRG